MESIIQNVKKSVFWRNFGSLSNFLCMECRKELSISAFALNTSKKNFKALEKSSKNLQKAITKIYCIFT
jgi:uncharacterized protein YlaI